MNKTDIKFCLKCIWLGCIAQLVIILAQSAKNLNQYIESQHTNEYEDWLNAEMETIWRKVTNE